MVYVYFIDSGIYLENLLKLGMKNSSFSRRKPTHRRHRLFKWLSPGLFIKRWLLLSASGFLLVIIGTAIWSKLTPIYRLLSLTALFLEFLTTVVPSYISGPIVLIVGVFLIYWGQSRTVGSITDVLGVDNIRRFCLICRPCARCCAPGTPT